MNAPRDYAGGAFALAGATGGALVVTAMVATYGPRWLVVIAAGVAVALGAATVALSRRT